MGGSTVSFLDTSRITNLRRSICAAAPSMTWSAQCCGVHPFLSHSYLSAAVGRRPPGKSRCIAGFASSISYSMSLSAESSISHCGSAKWWETIGAPL